MSVKVEETIKRQPLSRIMVLTFMATLEVAAGRTSSDYLEELTKLLATQKPEAA